MRSSIFDLVQEARDRNVTVDLAKTLDDGKPCAVRIRPLRIGDWLALGEAIPMPSGKSAEEWTPDEKIKYYEFLKRLAPVVVTQARHVAPQPAQNGTPASFVESWIDIKVVLSNPNHERNEISIDELESLGDALVRIGNAVLTDQDTGGEMATLPIVEVNPETGEPFRVEPVEHGDAGVVVGAAAASA